MDIVQVGSERGVSEGSFSLEVDGEGVPGLIWRPEDATGPTPMILIGHGGTTHKRVEYVLSLARRLVRHLGYSAVAIDAPGHGERVRDPEAAAEARRALEARIAGGPGEQPGAMSRFQTEEWNERNRRGALEWKATLDALVDGGLADESVGYWGVSMGTAIGLPYVASDPRIRAAVLGLAGLGRGGRSFETAARSLSMPVLFVFQWDDELMSRQSGLDLFDAIGSSDKAMHIFPGGHVQTPLWERDAYESFFTRHLGR